MGGIVFLILAALVVVTIVMGVRIVPQGSEWLVQRLGRFHAVLKPGLNFIIPYVDTVARKVETREIPLQIEPQEAISKDQAVLVVDAIAFIKVVDPAKAMYGVTDFIYATKNLVMTSLRAIIGGMTLNEALASRDLIKTRLREMVSQDIADWGITIKSVELQDIRPSEAMQRAMEAQAAADRTKQAMITQAEGKKAAAILEAEGKLGAAEKEAQAVITLAESSAKAIAVVSESIGDKTVPAMYLLGERYITTLSSLATSANAKTILLPADIQKTLAGMLGKA